MIKKIIILGASVYYLKTIEKARALGYYTIVLDMKENSPGFEIADDFYVIDISDYEAVWICAKKHNIDGIVPLNDYGVYTAAFVSDKLGLSYLDVQTAKKCIDKYKMRLAWDCLDKCNPLYAKVSSYDECAEHAISIGFPVILKPVVSMGGSRGVIVVNSLEDLRNAYEYSIGFYENKDILVEELLEGKEHSVEVIVINEVVNIIAMSDKIKTKLPYRVDKNVIYPTVLKDKQMDNVEKVITSAVNALGIRNGYLHLECCSLPDGKIKLFEIGARPGGGGTPDPIVPFVSGIDAIAAYIRLCVGDECQIDSFKMKKACNYHFITPAPGHIKKISGWKNISNEEDVLDFGLLVQEGSIISKVKIGSDRAGFIIVGGSDRNTVLERGNLLEKQISFEYY